MTKQLAARITRSGRTEEQGYSEPYAMLPGRRFAEPMGWNRSGRVYEAGTLGVAEYIRRPNASLYRFTALDEMTDRDLCALITSGHGTANMHGVIEFPDRQGPRGFYSLRAAAAHAVETILSEAAERRADAELEGALS